MPYEEVAANVRNAIENYFKLELGRPEILNRIGENIVIFDFIRPDVAKMILDAQIKKITKTLLNEKKITLIISEAAMETLTSAALSNLSNGGRGIGNIVESFLINPLARYLFDNSVYENAEVTIESLNHNQSTVDMCGHITQL